MKRCIRCGEEFEDGFRFCPIDGVPAIDGQGNTTSREFSLTLMSDAGLAGRLARELKFIADQFQRAWPAFKREPLATTKTYLRALSDFCWLQLSRPNLISGAVTSLAVVSAIILAVVVLEHHSRKTALAVDEAEVLVETTIDFRDEAGKNPEQGMGAGEKGRVGFNRGKGEGSRPDPARSHGGGGGGDRALLSASRGRLPQPSLIPAPIPTTYARLPQALPDAGIDLDPALWRNLNLAAYGDPRSKSTTPSNGPGDGRGVGSGTGLGVGEGKDNGVGPGQKGNMGGGSNEPGGGKEGGGGPGCGAPGCAGSRIYDSHSVSERARVLVKPEPQYTEEARRSETSGTVMLRVVFSSSGEVTNIRPVLTLPHGLTERAITAAKQIRFVPAKINGQPVSMYMQLEYNFNLY